MDPVQRNNLVNRFNPHLMYRGFGKSQNDYQLAGGTFGPLRSPYSRISPPSQRSGRIDLRCHPARVGGKMQSSLQGRRERIDAADG